MSDLPMTMAEAEIRPGVFLFPGRWEGEMREMTTAEEDMLLNRRQGRDWESINKVLQSCFLTPGVDVMDMLVGDRVFSLIQLRRITYGNEFVFRATCPRCNARFEWEENLGDLKVRYLEDQEYAKPEHTFSFTLPKSGKTLKWRMLRGRDERKMTTLRREHPDALMTSIMLLRVVEIEGEKMVTRKAFADLPASDAAAFRGEVEVRECGVDTGITVECPECWNVFDMDLPLAGQGFLLPTKAKTRGGR